MPDPRRPLTSLVAAVAIALTLGVVARAAAQPDPVDPWAVASDASGAMELSNYERARASLAALEAAAPDHPATLFARGKLAFHFGDYDAALLALDAAVLGAPGAAPIVALRDLVASTREVVADYAVFTTADGLFEIRYDATRDEVLIPWAAETLEAAYYEIGYDIGYWPEPPVRVEIYPRARTLARVSSLTEEAIEGSGTIALSKYNKLMFTSPRATLRGYDWRTTLAHEYVHHAVAHLVHADMPIWMHEALAKYLESRWEGRRNPRLDPSHDALLTERIAADRLITFAQMHPSMAYLPTPEDASTAYAQVFTVMEYLVERRGPGVIRDILLRVRDGDDVVASIEGAIGEPFSTFERSWMRSLRARPHVEVPGSFREELQLMPESGADPGVDRLAGVETVEARDHLRLGELLRARQMPTAAVVQYEKAEALLGGANPVLQNALARVYLDLGRADDALEALSQVVEWHPSYYPSHLHRGEALLALGRHQSAIEALARAGGVNPFDPAVHTHLAAAYDALGDRERVERHRRFAQLVAR